MGIPKTILWCDLETTGLDPSRDSVVEIAVFRADFTKPFFIKDKPDFHQVLRFENWGKVNSKVIEMHGKTGLLVESLLSDENSSIRVDDALFDQFFDVLPEKRSASPHDDLAILGGGSVGSFDLQFIRANFPKFAGLLHHRVYDVSALKLFCLSMGMPYAKGEPAHRATDDVLASIAEAKRCCDWLAAWGVNRPVSDG